MLPIRTPTDSSPASENERVPTYAASSGLVRTQEACVCVCLSEPAVASTGQEVRAHPSQGLIDRYLWECVMGRRSIDGV